MRKALLVALSLVALAGCDNDSSEKKPEYGTVQGYSAYSLKQVTDSDTCVIYYALAQYRGEGTTLTLRVDRNGKPLLNAQCLKEQEAK